MMRTDGAAFELGTRGHFVELRSLFVECASVGWISCMLRAMADVVLVLAFRPSVRVGDVLSLSSRVVHATLVALRAAFWLRYALL